MKVSAQLRRILIVALLSAVAALAGAATANAEGPVANSYVFEGELTSEGILRATETIEFRDAPDELVQRIALRGPVDQYRSRAYEISNVEATIAGQTVEPDITRSGKYLEVMIDTSQAGDQPVTISYEASGATRIERGETEDLTLFTWRVLQGLNVEAADVSGTLRVGSVPLLIDCVAGPPGAVQKCDLFSAGTNEDPMPYFRSKRRGAGEQVTLTVGVTAGSVQATEAIKEKWNLNRAFRLTPKTGVAALAAMILGSLGLRLLYRRNGMDLKAGDRFTTVATFTPIAEGEVAFEIADQVRPGHVGTVADEHVDPIDITATVLDLAVRGHLVITELHQPTGGVQDWRLQRTEQDTGRLFGFEKLLLEAIAPVGGSTLVSELPDTVAPLIPKVQEALYDDVVQRGWFDGRPDATRGNWRRIGWISLAVALLVGIVLVAFTNLGLLALVLVLLATLLIWLGRLMPRRTRLGTRLVNGLDVLAMLLATWPTDQMPKGREISEISRVLPYAVVLGGRRRWVEAMVAADDEDIPDSVEVGWYRAPEGWQLSQLPGSLNQFIHVVQGVLFSR